MSSEAERPSRDRFGSEYIAAIAEQRPSVDGHGYPGGQPDWDDAGRLYLNRLDPFSERSLVLPYWMALPLVRRLAIPLDAGNVSVADGDDSGETDSGKLKSA